jgi:hypothetical protein
MAGVSPPDALDDDLRAKLAEAEKARTAALDDAKRLRGLIRRMLDAEVFKGQAGGMGADLRAECDAAASEGEGKP